MKNIFFLLTCVLLAANMMAQDNYRRFQLNFAPQTMEIKDIKWTSDDNDEGWEDACLKTPGVGVGLIWGIGVSQTLPIFIETGFNVTYLHKSFEEKSDDHYYETTITNDYTFANISVPVKGVYNINITDEFSVAPFFGLNFKTNIIGFRKCTYDNIVSNRTYNKGEPKETKSSFFIKRDDDDEDWEEGYYFGYEDRYQANRFQTGLNIGVGINYKKLHLGWSFQPDLTRFAETDSYGDKVHKVKTRSQVLSLGINF